MSIIRSMALSAAFLLAFASNAQVVSEAAAKTIRTSKAEVVSFSISPKGDRLLVGLNKGAELYDLESGKKIFAFPYNEDGSTTVYRVGFNENGEYLLLIGHSGKRNVWDAKTGKQEKILKDHTWIPDPRAVKAMGLEMSNSAFDRFYQQSEIVVNGTAVRAAKNGAVEFVGADAKVARTITFPENKDQHHRAPLLLHDGQLLIGTDNGTVLFYTLL